MFVLLPILTDESIPAFTAPKNWEILSFEASEVPSYLVDELSLIGYVISDSDEAMQFALEADELGILTIGDHRFLGVLLSNEAGHPSTRSEY